MSATQLIEKITEHLSLCLKYYEQPSFNDVSVSIDFGNDVFIPQLLATFYKFDCYEIVLQCGEFRIKEQVSSAVSSEHLKKIISHGIYSLVTKLSQEGGVMKTNKEQIELAQLFIDSYRDENGIKKSCEVIGIDYGKGPYGGKIFCKDGRTVDIGGRYVRELQALVGDEFDILAEIKKRKPQRLLSEVRINNKRIK